MAFVIMLVSGAPPARQPISGESALRGAVMQERET